MKRVRMAALISGGGSNLQAILDAIGDGRIHGDMVLVISDQRDVYGLERARREGIPTRTIVKSDYPSRKDWNREILSTLQEYWVELVLLAGFMSILGGEVVRHYPNAMMNIHPALIPAFSGKGYYGHRVHRAVLDYGVKVTGATVHFVDEGTDTGPIILQEVVRVHPEDDVESLAKRVLEVEHRLYPKAVELFTKGRLSVQGRKVIIQGDEG